MSFKKYYKEYHGLTTTAKALLLVAYEINELRKGFERRNRDKVLNERFGYGKNDKS